MVMQLNGSVGSSGKNKPNDVRLVQGLLNAVPLSFGGPEKPLDVDGFIGPKTINAITRFQNKNFGWGDGRVDVGGKTFTQLADYAEHAANPSSPISAIANGGAPLNTPASATIDNGTTLVMAKVVSVTGSLCSNCGPFKANEMAGPGVMLFTLSKSTATLVMTNTNKITFMPPSHIWWVGKGNPVPTASVKWTKSGSTTPAASGKPAAYYQAGKPGVSSGYFKQ